MVSVQLLIRIHLLTPLLMTAIRSMVLLTGHCYYAGVVGDCEVGEYVDDGVGCAIDDVIHVVMDIMDAGIDYGCVLLEAYVDYYDDINGVCVDCICAYTACDGYGNVTDDGDDYAIDGNDNTDGRDNVYDRVVIVVIMVMMACWRR